MNISTRSKYWSILIDINFQVQRLSCNNLWPRGQQKLQRNLAKILSRGAVIVSLNHHHHTFSSSPGARVHLCCWLQWPRKAPRMFLSAHGSAQPSTGWSWYFSVLFWWWDQRDDLDECLGERKTNLASLQQGWCGPSPGIDLISLWCKAQWTVISSHPKWLWCHLMQSDHWLLMSSYQDLANYHCDAIDAKRLEYVKLSKYPRTRSRWFLGSRLSLWSTLHNALLGLRHRWLQKTRWTGRWFYC